MATTKVDVNLISASGTPGSGNFLRGDGSWQAVSSGLNFISNTDISAAATYNFTAFTAGSFEHYIFYLQNLIPVTDDVHLWVRTSTDGGSSYDAGGSDYNWGGFGGNASFVEDAADGQFAATGNGTSAASTIGSTSTESGVSGTLQLFGPHTTSFTHIQSNLTFHNASAALTHADFGGARVSAADVDGFQILFESGNIESGTITAYGLANA